MGGAVGLIEDKYKSEWVAGWSEGGRDRLGRAKPTRAGRKCKLSNGKGDLRRKIMLAARRGRGRWLFCAEICLTLFNEAKVFKAGFLPQSSKLKCLKAIGIFCLKKGKKSSDYNTTFSLTNSHSPNQQKRFFFQWHKRGRKWLTKTVP